MASTTTRTTQRTERQALVSIVVPAYNEERNLPQLYGKVCAALATAGWTFELIIVDDGSTDRTCSVIEELRRQDPRVQRISLSRNFGHQAALLAGMAHSRGDVVITMDSDLQHPPELLPRMLRLWQQGHDVVHTIKRTDVSASLVRRATAKVFYGCFAKLSGLSMGFGQADFRLLDAYVAMELCRLPERHKFLRGLVSWMGFDSTTIEYDVAPRLNGRSSYRLMRRLQFHTDAILSFSIIPLRLFTLLGLLICVPAGLYGTVALIEGLYALMFGYPSGLVPGWASLAVFVTLLGGIQLIGIGMLGEYLGRIFEQSKARPPYLISDTSLPARREPHDSPDMIPIERYQGAPPSVHRVDA